MAEWDNVLNVVYTAALIFLAVMLLLCLLRAVRGPRVADRIVAVNMMGTMVMVMIAILALKMKEGYLIDICIIYAMISFLAVVVLTKVYMGVYRERKIQEQKGQKLQEQKTQEQKGQKLQEQKAQAQKVQEPGLKGSVTAGKGEGA